MSRPRRNGVIGLVRCSRRSTHSSWRRGWRPLSTVVERMTSGPATPPPPVRELRAGAAANLALWNLGESWLVEPPTRC